MSEIQPTLSIILVNSDGRQDTMNCLESVFKNHPIDDFEVILVDNCSAESIESIVKERYPQVIFLNAPEKQGFSKNYNLGLRAAKGQYLLIINNDTIVHPGALDSLVTYIRTHPKYGMVGPLLLSEKGEYLPVCARQLMSYWMFVFEQLLFDKGMPLGKLLHKFHRYKLKQRKTGPVECISGACMLTSKRAISQVGLLDENYVFYFEDIEWCYRMQKYGFLVGYVAEARITHLGDQSLSKVRYWAKQSEYRGALHYFGQNRELSKGRIWNLWLSTTSGYLLRAFYFSIKKTFTNQENHAQTYWRLFDWIRHQPPNVLSN